MIYYLIINIILLYILYMTIIIKEHPGYSKKLEYSEDKIICYKINNYQIIGVADGHDSKGNGKLISSYIAENFINLFREHLNYNFVNINQLLINITIILHINVNTYINDNNISGGSTLSICIIDESINMVYLYNLGDSISMIFRKIEDTQEYKIYFKTTKQIVPNQPNEFTGGFGDVNDIFLIRTPEINQVPLMKDDYIFITTDGLYEGYDFTIQKLISIRTDEDIITDFNDGLITDNYNILEHMITKQINYIYNQLKGVYSIEQIEKSFDNHAIILYTQKYGIS